MKKVLYMNLYRNDATHFYRLAVLSAIKHPDLIIEERPYSGEVTWASFIGYDAIILERPSSSHDLQIIKLAKQVGVRVFSDWDDDCLHIPVIHPMWHFYKQCRADVMECLALSDEVWVSTPALKKAYSLLNKNIHVIPNALNNYLFPVEQKKMFNTETKKAFWRGGGSHEADVYSVVPELIKVINGNMDWQFQFIGCRFIYMELQCGENYTPVSSMPLMQYFEYMNAERPNIVFHPLQENVFNHSKSNIAWLEATYAGAAFFSSSYLNEFNQPGIIPIEQFTSLINHTDLQKGTNEVSWEYVKENLLLSNVNELRVKRLLAI